MADELWALGETGYPPLSDERVRESIVRLYEIHDKYRDRADLSAAMGLRGYISEFILDVLELQKGGLLKGAGTWCDIGSGGGYPGLPLAIILTGTVFTLVEPVARKAEYLRIAARALGLANVTVGEYRLGDATDTYDAISCKALKIDYGNALKRLLKPGGKAYIFGEPGEIPGFDKSVLQYRNLWNGKTRTITIFGEDVSRETGGDG